MAGKNSLWGISLNRLAARGQPFADGVLGEFGAILSLSNLSNANLQNASLDSARMDGSMLIRANLEHAGLRGGGGRNDLGLSLVARMQVFVPAADRPAGRNGGRQLIRAFGEKKTLLQRNAGGEIRIE